MKKVVVFDMDGVLVDTIDTMFAYSQIRYPGIDWDGFRQIAVGNIHEESQKLKQQHNLEESDEEREERRQRYAEEKSKSRLYHGVQELLPKLRDEGYILTINTGAWRRNTDTLLENTGIQNYFDTILLAEDSTSKVEKFHILCETYHVEPTEMLFITDTLGDLKEANETGVPTLAVTWGAHDHTFFTNVHFDNLIGIVDTVNELETSIHTFFKK